MILRTDPSSLKSGSSSLAPFGRRPVPDMLALGTLDEPVLDEHIQIWHHSMKIQVAGIDNLRLGCPPVVGLDARYVELGLRGEN